MTKLYPLFVFFLCFICICNANTKPERPLIEKAALLSKYLQRAFGPSNPFQDRCSTIYLTAELHTLLSKNNEAVTHYTVLEHFLVAMEHAVDEGLVAFARATSNSTALKMLTQTTNKAEFYIHAHLGSYLQHCTYTKRFARKQNRILGTLLGISLMSGVVKYIIVAIAGATLLGLCYSMLSLITRDIDEIFEEIKYNQKAIDTLIANSCIAAKNYLSGSHEQHAGYHLPLEKKKGGGLFRRCLNRLFINPVRSIKNWWRMRKIHKKETIEQGADSISALITYLQAHSPQNRETLAEAERAIKQWKHIALQNIAKR